MAERRKIIPKSLAILSMSVALTSCGMKDANSDPTPYHPNVGITQDPTTSHIDYLPGDPNKHTRDGQIIDVYLNCSKPKDPTNTVDVHITQPNSTIHFMNITDSSKPSKVHALHPAYQAGRYNGSGDQSVLTQPGDLIGTVDGMQVFAGRRTGTDSKGNVSWNFNISDLTVACVGGGIVQPKGAVNKKMGF